MRNNLFLDILSELVIKFETFLNIFLEFFTLLWWDRWREEVEKGVLGYGLLDDPSLLCICDAR
jgi:hypothetical protein